MIDRVTFYEIARPLFGGTLTQSQVDGMNAILDQWDTRSPNGDKRWLAYMLGTTKHETGDTMKPIEEWGKGRGHSYGVPDVVTGQTYYGRGYVQLTWKANYKTMGDLLGIDLVNHPEKALEPQVAADIMFKGMERGLFTGVGLPKYFNPTTEDWINARRIINGLDKAQLIANYAKGFYVGL